MLNRYLLPLLLISATLTLASSALAQPAWVESNAGLEGAFAAALGFDSTGRPLIGTACGLYRHDGARWGMLLDQDSVASIHVTPVGTILAGSASGLWRRTPSQSDWIRVMAGYNVSDMIQVGAGRVLAVVDAKLFQSTDDGVSWTADDNLPQQAAGQVELDPDGVIYAWRQWMYRSLDSGATWTEVAERPAPPVALPLGSGMLIGTWGDSSQVSTDGGRTWYTDRELPANELRRTRSGALASVGLRTPYGVAQTTPAGLYRLDASGALDDRLLTGTVHAGVEGPNGELVVSASPDLLRSTDGGATWSLINEGLGCGRLGYITVDREGRMYAVLFGLEWTSNAVMLGTLHRSDDSGRTWQRLRAGMQTVLGAFSSGEVIGLARDFTFGYPRLWTSRDHGATWNGRPGRAPSMSAWVSGNDSGATAVSFSLDQTTIGDTTGIVWISRDTARSYTEQRVGRRSDPVAITSRAVSVAVTGTGAGQNGLYSSSDDGATWSQAIATNTVVDLQRSRAGDLYALVTPPPGESRFRLWRSTDGGVSWIRQSIVASAGPLRIAPSGVLLIRPYEPTAPLYRSTDHGLTWDSVSVPFSVNDRFDFLDDGRIAVVLPADNALTKLESRDSGRTWQSIAVVRPPSRPTSARVAPWGELFAHTVPERLMRYVAGTSSVGADGRAMNIDQSTRLSIIPVPVDDRASLSIDVRTATTARLRVHDLNGRSVLRERSVQLVSGANLVELDLGELSPGIYVVSVEAPMLRGSTRLLVR